MPRRVESPADLWVQAGRTFTEDPHRAVITTPRETERSQDYVLRRSSPRLFGDYPFASSSCPVRQRSVSDKRVGRVHAVVCTVTGASKRLSCLLRISGVRIKARVGIDV